MLPTIKECQQLPEAEKSALEGLDYQLRVALIELRRKEAGSAIANAAVTVVLSVAADAAMLASNEGEPPSFEAFLEAARQAFHWSQMKRAHSVAARRSS